MEHYWTGWKAWQDGKNFSLTPAEWLTVETKAGAHGYSFRYRPWDVWVGITLTLSGIAGCIFFWRKPSEKNRVSNTETDN
jgi:uncharacterized membrane protein YfhO